MTGIVAEDRAYNLQRQLETHAKKNLELQENSKQTRIQLTLMLSVFSALMAWGFLDRLTGNSWTVMNRVKVLQCEACCLLHAVVGIARGSW